MILETKRLILRPPRKSDWKDVKEGAGDIKVSRMTALIPHPYKKKDALLFIKDVNKSWRKKEKTSYVFFIELKKEKKVVGVTELLKINKQNKKAQTGSWINRKYWRKGYIIEAKIPVLDFAFNKLKLRKIETGARVENKASNEMQKKLGFKLEGKRRKALICKATGKIHDEYIYGLLKEEWRKNRGKVIKSVANKIKQWP